MKRIVIVGGGFSAIESALLLSKNKSNVEILVIHDDDCFTFVPALYETSAGELDEANVCLLTSHLLYQKGVLHYKDKVVKIDPKNKYVQTEHIKKLRFDCLILGVGAQTNYYDIKGAKEHCLNLKSKDDAQRIFERVSVVLAKKKAHKFVICGGGLTGVELACSLIEHIRRVCKENRVSSDLFSVSVVEASPSILSNLPDEAIRIATKYLDKLDVSLHVNTCISSITKRSLHITDKQKIAFNTAIWCGGLRTHDVLLDSKLSVVKLGGGRGMPGGGMVVNDFLQSADYSYIFGAGDCICAEKGKKPFFKTAQNAADQASYVSQNALAYLNGKKLKKYVQRDQNLYCSLGKSMGIHVHRDVVRAGKGVKMKKDKLESSYVKALQFDKVRKPLYG